MKVRDSKRKGGICMTKTALVVKIQEYIKGLEDQMELSTPTTINEIQHNVTLRLVISNLIFMLREEE